MQFGIVDHGIHLLITCECKSDRIDNQGITICYFVENRRVDGRLAESCISIRWIKWLMTGEENQEGGQDLNRCIMLNKGLLISCK